MNDEVSYIGFRDGIGGGFKVVQDLFGITQKDRANHLYLVGKTGTGKSTLQKNLIIQDIQAGRGVCLLDPHGDQAEELLDYIPRARAQSDVIYFDPADLEYPMGLNFFPSVPPDERHRIANHILSVFVHIWNLSDEGTPRLINLLYIAIASVLEHPGSTLLSVYRLLVDDVYREQIVAGLSDPVLVEFWRSSFPRDPRRREEVIGSTLTRVERLVSSPVLRNTIGQVSKTIDFGKAMNEGKIIICNLSKGRLGEEASGLLGSIILIQLYLASLERAHVPESERSPFYLYVDEFQNFGTSVFADILSESRKYRLSLTLAHQFTSQLSQEVREAIIGNVGSIISFRVGHSDAELLAHEFSQLGHELSPHALSDLDAHEVRALIQDGGAAAQPFLAKTMPPLETGWQGEREFVVSRSRRNYARPRVQVEQGIKHRLTR